MFGSKKSLFGLSGSHSPQDDSLNLIPIMNLFVALIPFLLICAAFFNVSVINASVPALQKDRSDLASTEDSVTLMVQVLPTGYRISASSETLDKASLEALRTEIPRQGEKPDLERFTRHLAACKELYPKSDTMILVADPSILYQELIETMDAARTWKTSEEGREVVSELFPNVVVAGML